MIALGVAAGSSKRIRVGTGICLLSERDPIITAKETATIDFLSGGRFIFGVGAGWETEELRNHGTDPARRWTVTEERVRAISEIWTQDEAQFHGGTSTSMRFGRGRSRSRNPGRPFSLVVTLRGRFAE